MKTKKLKTLVIGASTNPSRQSYLAVSRLNGLGHDVIAVGAREGEINGVKIQTDLPQQEDIHTITLYLNAVRQEESIKEYMDSINVQRVIFNPGAENRESLIRLRSRGILAIEACTMVLLSTGQY